MSASGCLSSPYWMTPRAGENDETVEAYQARRSRIAAADRPGETGTLTLQAKAWPTPTSRDHRSIHAGEETHQRNARPLSEVVGQWATPQARLGDGRAAQAKRWGDPNRHGGWNLDDQVAALWATTRSSDGEKGGPNQAFGAGGTPLPAMASQWATPRSHEVGQYQYSRGDKAKPVATLTGQAFSLHRPEMPALGKPSWRPILSAFQRYRATTDSSLRAELRALIRLAIKAERRGERREHTRPSFRRSLNPIFVADLMGWPDRWTRCVSTSSGSSATALSLFKQRMRSALSQLGSPQEAPPAQLALFG
jgi:hypothetical protein